MLNTINLFKRHFHKCDDVVELLRKKGKFDFNLTFTEESLKLVLSTPDADTTVRFIVLLRRFLSPTDNLYYRKVWDKLCTVFDYTIPQEIKESIAKLEQRFIKGQIKLVIDNVEYTAEQVYSLISQGTYFDEDVYAKTILQQLTSNPVTKLLFWNQFYTYSIIGFQIVSQIFEAIKHIQTSEKYKRFIDATKLAKPQCIYCLSTGNSFSSEEHIFPESLGNEEMLLLKGFVCDECNNGVLSGLDEYLINFEPIALLRVYFVPYDKKGKLPKANFQNMIMEKTHPRHLKFTAKDKTGRMREKKDLGDGWVSWQLKTRGKRPDMKKLGRALYKIALGTMALDHGSAKVLDSRYDLARNFIHGKSDFPNNLLIRMSSEPHPQFSITYWDHIEGTPFEIDIYGLSFLINLSPLPLMQVVEPLKELRFEAFPLYD